MASDYQLYVRDRYRRRSADLDAFISFEAEIRWNDVSDWVLTIDGDLPAADQYINLDTYNGVVLRRGADIMMSGPFREIKQKEDIDGNILEVYGIDDTGLLAERVATPGTFPFGSVATDQFTGSGEACMHYYVHYNMGPGAPDDRKIPILVMVPHSNLGATITTFARFDNLMTLLQKISLQSGGVRFRIRQDLPQPGLDNQPSLLFSTNMPEDRRGRARFSKEFGNIESMEFVEGTPAVNSVYVGGQGEGTSRLFAFKRDSDSVVRYGLIEDFIDSRNEEDAATLAKAAEDALTAGAAPHSFTFTPSEVDQLKFGIDYDLGDRVSVIIDGVTFDGIVTSVHVSITAENGVLISPTVTTMSIPQLLTQSQQGAQGVNRRVSRLERFAENLTDTQIAAKGFGTFALVEHDAAHADAFSPVIHGNANHSPAFAPTPHGNGDHTTPFSPAPHDSTYHQIAYALLEHDAEHDDRFLQLINAPSIATNTYTGNGGVTQRQITTGFLCKLVLLQRPDGSIWVIMNTTNSLFIGTGNVIQQQSSVHLHTSNGFWVADGAVNGNVNGDTYRWVAFK